MNYRVLGRTGLRVSEIGMGAWAIGGNQFGNSYGPTDDEESRRATRKALDMGCNFFDTADVYGHGHSEELLGKVLGPVRDEVIIATKGGGDFYSSPPRANFSPDYIRSAAEQSLLRLRTDRIDLYQLHNPPPPMIEDGAVFGILRDLQGEGKIRFAGLSIFDPREGLAALQHGTVDALQVVFNLLRWEPARDLFRAAAGEGVGIIAREPLHNGFLTGKFSRGVQFPPGDIRATWPAEYVEALMRTADGLRFLECDGRTLAQAALQFCLAHRAVSVAIAGCKTEAQVVENFSAPSAPRLKRAELDRVIAVLFGKSERSES